MTPRSKLLVITVPFVAAGALILASIIASKSAPERIEIEERATAVRVIEAQVQSLRPGLIGFGLVSPSRTYEAIPQVGGTATYVNPLLHKGEILPAGAVLLRLSPEDFTLAIAQARANIRAAEAKLAEMAVSEQNQLAALAIEEDTLAIRAADLARSESLFESEAISQTVLDNARAAFLAQSQRVLNIQGALNLLPTQRAVQTEQISVFEATLSSAELNLERSEVRLPFAARVSMANVETGQFVKAGQTIASFDGIDAAEAEAQLSLSNLRTLFVEARTQAGVSVFDPEAISDVLKTLGIEAVVRLRLDEAVVEWPAELDRISNVIDPKTGTLGIIVRVESPYTVQDETPRPPLTKGMFVEVELTAPPVQGVVIPRSALDQGRVLLADETDRLRILRVTPTLLQGEIALIKTGLPEGSRVVVSRPRPVIEGMLLLTTPDDAAFMDAQQEAGR